MVLTKSTCNSVGENVQKVERIWVSLSSCTVGRSASLEDSSELLPHNPVILFLGINPRDVNVSTQNLYMNFNGRCQPTMMQL